MLVKELAGDEAIKVADTLLLTIGMAQLTTTKNGNHSVTDVDEDVSGGDWSPISMRRDPRDLRGRHVGSSRSVSVRTSWSVTEGQALKTSRLRDASGIATYSRGRWSSACIGPYESLNPRRRKWSRRSRTSLWLTAIP